MHTKVYALPKNTTGIYHIQYKIYIWNIYSMIQLWLIYSSTHIVLTSILFVRPVAKIVNMDLPCSPLLSHSLSLVLKFLLFSPFLQTNNISVVVFLIQYFVPDRSQQTINSRINWDCTVCLIYLNKALLEYNHSYSFIC